MKPRRANPGRAAVSAFTLIELMVVMGLMMIIIAIGVPKWCKATGHRLAKASTR